jgi:hypothetical protein
MPVKDKIAVQQAVSAGLEAEGVDIGRIWHVLHTEIFQHWPEPQPACEVCGQDCCGYLRGWADCKASSERSEPAAASVPRYTFVDLLERMHQKREIAAKLSAGGDYRQGIIDTVNEIIDTIQRNGGALALSSAPGERT